MLLRGFANYYKLKTHKGLAKRVKIFGSLYEREFWHYPVGK